MKQIILFLLFATGLVSSVHGQTMPLYENRGVVNEPLNIDATSFLNAGPFDVSYGGSGASVYFYYSTYGTLELFDTQNTLYYTNLANGSMTASGGFDFFFQTNGFQYPASAFENYGYINGQIVSLEATNIVNIGTIKAEGGGLVRFTGENVNLSRGGIGAIGSGSTSGIPGVSNGGETPIQYGLGNGDALDGVSDPQAMDPSTFSLPYPTSPTHWVMSSAYQGYIGFGNISFTTRVPLYYSYTNLTGYTAFANTNRVNSTSEVVQVIFVNTNCPDTNISVKAGFANYYSPQMRGNMTAVVQWSLPGYDTVAARPLTNYLTFTDRFGTQTNALYKTNYSFGNLRGDITGVNSYNIYRGTQPYFYSFTNNAVFNTNLLVNPAYTNLYVTNSYVSYGATIGQQSTQVNPLDYIFGTTTIDVNPALSDPTNQPARVEINAGNLDISYSRLQADNMLMINATNLISLEGMVLDSPVVKYNVGSTNGTLVVSNFVVASVSRLLGDLYAYSAVWTNGYSSVDAGVTNDVEVRCHVLIVDHYLQGSTPVDVYSLIGKATNIVVQDSLYVSHQFRMDSESFDLRGLVTGLALDTNTALIFPRLKYLTNSGSYSTIKGAFYGERLTNMQDIVNHGSFTAQGLTFKANTLVNDGTLSSGYGSMRLDCKLAKLDQGQIKAAGDLIITADEVKARNSRITAGSINLNVTNLLSDAGYVSSGMWSSSNGFNLNVKPASGDLLGTTFSSSAVDFKQSLHKWAGENRGATRAGFTDNAAIGKLILDGGRFSRFSFSGTGTNNALYVDYLQLNNNATNLDGLTPGVAIATNMTVYFAAANLPVEQVNGKINGRLKWVNTFAGPNSSTNITLANGQILKVNLGLLTSQTIDSDADGIANGRDTTPFGGIRLASITVTNMPSSVTNLPPVQAQISWNGAAQTAYNVEFATNLMAPAWQLLTNVVNSASTNKLLSVLDMPAKTDEQRYYRVSYTP